MRLIRITESSIYPMRFRFHERWHLAFCQSLIWCERRCNGGRLARVSCCGKPGELTKLQASVTAAERENQQRWDGLQRVQPSSNPELGVEFEHELMPLCLREYNINGFHEGWKGHRAKKKKKKKWASCVMLKQPTVVISWETLYLNAMWMFR